MQECSLKTMDFNPRSREGSDAGRNARSWKPNDFNPRSREGSDLGQSLEYDDGWYISIHAPAKGATFKSP